MTTDKFDLVLARADRVMRQIDERDGAVRSAAQRERAHDPVGAGEDEVELVGGHFFSIGVNGELAFSSRPCDTPSARAI